MPGLRYPVPMDVELFQPGLFSPANIALGEAREAMDALHFDQAAGLYRSILARWPEMDEEAREGLELALKWAAFFGDGESGASVEGFGGRLLCELKNPQGSRLPGRLRTALLEHCLRVLGQDQEEALRYGECLLLLDRPEEAFLWAEDASFPDSDLQYRFFLARTAWQSGRRRLARKMWSRLILEGLESGEEILDPRFRELIVEFGAVPAL